jgi:hypothetical protein
MADSDLVVVEALSAAWTRIRREDERIPAVVIDIGPRRSSSCTSVGWAGHSSGSQLPVLCLNLRPAGTNLTGREAMAWLLHQAGHALAGTGKSSEGRFHPEAYRQAAESLGLAVMRKTSGGTGWSETSLPTSAVSRYKPQIQKLDRALTKWTPTEQVNDARDSRNPDTALCSCGRKIRIQRSTLAVAPVICGRCNQEFRLV